MNFPAMTWVTLTRDNDHRTGRVVFRIEGHSTKLFQIQFGDDGPFEVWAEKDLRFATNEEIAEKEGTRPLKGNADRDNLQELETKE